MVSPPSEVLPSGEVALGSLRSCLPLCAWCLSDFAAEEPSRLGHICFHVSLAVLLAVSSLITKSVSLCIFPSGNTVSSPWEVQTLCWIILLYRGTQKIGTGLIIQGDRVF